MAIVGERTKTAVEYRNKHLLECVEKFFSDPERFLRDFFFESSYYYAEITVDGNDVTVYAENDGSVKIILEGIVKDNGIEFYGGKLMISFYYDVPYTAYVDFSSEMAIYIYDWMAKNGIEINEDNPEAEVV